MEESASLLIIDDERGPTESLRMIFKPSYKVFTAAGAEQALSILRTTPIDVVTLDLRMPGMPGIELLERIKEHDPDIEVIIVTGYAALDTAIRGLRHHVFDYITKPFDVPHIADLVRRAVGRRRASVRMRNIKEDFLANLSHELRTPLSAIIGYGAILAEELQSVVNTEQRTALDRIQANSQELLTLIEGVLLLNSLDAGEVPLTVRPFDLAETVRRVGHRYRGVAGDKGLTVDIEIRGTDLIAVSDEEKLERILSALLDNAVKFTPRGGVTLSVRSAPQPGALEIEVSDTGIGMGREEIVHALQGLAQTDSSSRRRYRGLGLGLRIATRLVEFLGGDLRIRSEAGQGTQCIVTLPAGRLGGKSHLPHLN
ncbi:MAG TPA: hybrid sensor histidine kinase/response regulator [Candidatus Binatia bacterium]|nr:hybrid sensor histidine kinase/response regulator [Candidatus Binatia bacterium]